MGVVHELNHPLIQHKLSILRSKRTNKRREKHYGIFKRNPVAHRSDHQRLSG